MDEHRREEAYRVYCSDGLKIVGNLNIRYVDLLKPQEKRTAEEIIGHIKDKLRAIGGD